MTVGTDMNPSESILGVMKMNLPLLALHAMHCNMLQAAVQAKWERHRQSSFAKQLFPSMSRHTAAQFCLMGLYNIGQHLTLPL